MELFVKQAKAGDHQREFSVDVDSSFRSMVVANALHSCTVSRHVPSSPSVLKDTSVPY